MHAPSWMRWHIYTQLQLRLEDVKFEASLGYLDLASENLNQTQIIRNFIMFFLIPLWIFVGVFQRTIKFRS